MATQTPSCSLIIHLIVRTWKCYVLEEHNFFTNPNFLPSINELLVRYKAGPSKFKQECKLNFGTMMLEHAGACWSMHLHAGAFHALVVFHTPFSTEGGSCLSKSMECFSDS
jgi:hypothetical protein